jgi:hypothetical protein
MIIWRENETCVMETAGAKPGENVCERFVYAALMCLHVLYNMHFV